MKLKGPFVKLVMFDKTLAQLKKGLCSNQNSKSKDSMVQFRFLSIHISYKT